MKLIIAKKIRDDDKETQLKIAFELIAEACVPEGKQFNPDEIKCHSDMFKELLMTLGLKFSEEQADDILNLMDSV